MTDDRTPDDASDAATLEAAYIELTDQGDTATSPPATTLAPEIPTTIVTLADRLIAKHREAIKLKTALQSRLSHEIWYHTRAADELRASRDILTAPDASDPIPEEPPF